MSQPDLNRATREALADALGFVIGGLAGRHLGLAFGADFLAEGWGGPQMAGLVLVIVGCGLGRWIFRKLLVKP